jgi:flagellar basal-body rod modification protein FlgD
MNITSDFGTRDAAAAPAAKSSGDNIGTKENFLQLLVAQIKHQNPLNPADGTQFLSQLSQFTEMEQMLAMRQDLEAIRASLEAAASSESNS